MKAHPRSLKALHLPGVACLFCFIHLPIFAGVQYEVIGNLNPDVANSRGGLASDGTAFFGASFEGGTADSGAVYRYDPVTTVVTAIHSFTTQNTGHRPVAGLIRAADGRLYGQARGGSANLGLIYGINTNGSGYAVLHEFAALSGWNGQGVLLHATDNRLYGIATEGGGFSRGGIFRIDLNGTNYQLLRAVSGTSGVAPGTMTDVEGPGGVIQLDDTRLYGVAGLGGSSDKGVVFRMDLDGGDYTVLHTFTGGDGGGPAGELCHASDGRLYGVCNDGGQSGEGVVYGMNPDGTGFSVLHSFAEPDGIAPTYRLIEGSDRFLYGTTAFGSNNGGIAYRLPKSGDGFSVLHRFDIATGNQPFCNLLESAVAGVFLGSTPYGGTNNKGVVFRLSTSIESPLLRVTGPARRSTGSSKIKLQGTASDDLGIQRVEYSDHRTWKPARRTTRWTLVARLKSSGTTRIRVRSVDTDGIASAIKTIRIKRDAR